VHAAHGVGEQPRGRVLDDETAGPGCHRLTQVAGPAERGDHEDLAARRVFGQLPGHRDPVEARHLDVEQRDIDAVGAHRFQHLVASPDLGDDREIALHFEQCRHRATDQGLVVGEEQPDRVAGH